MSSNEDPTFESHLASHTPCPEWVDGKEWSWSFRKFGYAHGGVLFTELHEEFNSFKCAIQDPFGWHLDVAEIANLANTREELFSLLRERRKERFAEIYNAWFETTSLLVGEPGRWDTVLNRVQSWENFSRISRDFSYDSLLNFFGEYVKDDNSRPGAQIPNPPNPASGPQQQLPNQPPFEASDAGRIEFEQPPRRPEQESRATRPRSTRTRAPRTKESRTEKIPAPATNSPNKITRKTRRRNVDLSVGGGLRRSARLRERAERESR
ncbi:hypothetical protein GGR51DRAFT_543535 [Nemania sp. FL0031]|nr:hypothetical protein GGR51DRAFT_543535 [Nemania sp. FL0031]